jgi:ABC-type anion transport system duplicated permease subunit
VLLRDRKVSLGVVIWVVVGVIVAANHHFLDHPNTLSKVLSAILAVAAWPLVVLQIHVAI